MTIKKTLEIQVEIEVQLNENEYKPSDFAIDKNEDEFTIQDSENFEESLSKEADERAIKTVNKKLSEAIQEVEKNLKKSNPLYEGGYLELFHITDGHIENTDDNWEIIGETSGYV